MNIKDTDVLMSKSKMEQSLIDELSLLIWLWFLVQPKALIAYCIYNQKKKKNFKNTFKQSNHKNVIKTHSKLIKLLNENF